MSTTTSEPVHGPHKRRFYGLAAYYGLACGLSAVWFLYRNLMPLTPSPPWSLQALSFAGVLAAGLCFYRPRVGWYGLMAVALGGFLSAGMSMNGPSMAANGFVLTMLWRAAPPAPVPDADEPESRMDRINRLNGLDAG